MSTPARASRSRRLRRPGRLLGRWRRDPPEERTCLAVLVLASVLLLYLGVEHGVGAFPPVMQVLPVLAGGLLLGRHAMRALVIVVLACLAYEVYLWGLTAVRPGALVTVLAASLVAYEFARSRHETGLGGLRGDTVLVELRRRLEQQGRLPGLPAGWQAEAVVRPAGGGA